MGLNTSVHFSLRYFLLSQDWSGLIRSSAVMNSSTIPIQVGKGVTVEPWRSWHKFAVLPPDGSRDLLPLCGYHCRYNATPSNWGKRVAQWLCCHMFATMIEHGSFPDVSYARRIFLQFEIAISYVHFKKIVSSNLSIRKIIFSKVSGVLGYIIIYYNSSWTILKWMNEVDPVGFEKNVILSFFYNILSNIVL